MNKKCSNALYEALLAYRETIINTVREIKKNDKKAYKKNKCKKKTDRDYIKHYPAAIVGCERYGSSKDRNCNCSQFPLNIQKFHPELKRKLRKLGPIGTKADSNVIGGCAEVHAANYVMNHHKKGLNTLAFTVALSPRTGRKKLYCKNCQFTFGLSNE